MGNISQLHGGGHGSSYKELGPQNIFTTTQVAHHMSGTGMGGLGLAPGTHFGTSHLAAQNQMSSTSQHQGSLLSSGHRDLNQYPLVSSTQQNYKYNLPNHFQDYQMQLKNYQLMQGRVQTSLGGNLFLN